MIIKKVCDRKILIRINASNFGSRNILHFHSFIFTVLLFHPAFFLHSIDIHPLPFSHLRASMNVSWSECTALYRENTFSIGSSWTSNARELFRSFSTIFKHDTTKYLFPSRRNGGSTFPDASRHSPNFSPPPLPLSLSLSHPNFSFRHFFLLRPAFAPLPCFSFLPFMRRPCAHLRAL